MNLESLKTAFQAAQCVQLYAKVLAANDNSKNQVYLSGAVESLHMFRPTGIVSSNSSKGPTFKGRIDFGWLQESGAVIAAPRAQIILYSQYPEVRLSGFLAGCDAAPNELMTARLPGRVLFLGISRDGKVVAYVAASDSALAAEFAASPKQASDGVLFALPLDAAVDVAAARTKLLSALRGINAKGWIASKQLDSAGTVRPCNAPQCGGFTLEAELGVPKNSRAEADYEGWEVKSYSVASFDRPLSAGPVTLFTPEPTGGAYRTLGLEGFMRTFGYSDRRGRADRVNFGGTFFVGQTHPLTGLGLVLNGFDSEAGKIVDADGSVDLVSSAGVIAASWSFSSILEHWNRKHRYAAYVPSRKQSQPQLSYSYGHIVHLAEHTNHERLLQAFANRFVYYDPAIKIENVSSATPRSKKRSQFRVRVAKLGVLYKSLSAVDVRGSGE
jgi:hypothetical protein